MVDCLRHRSDYDYEVRETKSNKRNHVRRGLSTLSSSRKEWYKCGISSESLKSAIEDNHKVAIGYQSIQILPAAQNHIKGQD
ncbi:MAG: hypothetical protein ACJA1A_001840 [Saprospiraceae bacterium]|jgi:hypothetical protein